MDEQAAWETAGANLVLRLMRYQEAQRWTNEEMARRLKVPLDTWTQTRTGARPLRWTVFLGATRLLGKATVLAWWDAGEVEVQEREKVGTG